MAGTMLVLLGSALLAVATAFPSGAPSLACATMMPAHFPSTKTGVTPFAINVSSETYEPGSTIEGMLYSPSGEKLKGFFIVADTTNVQRSITNITGTFTVTDMATQQLICGKNNNQGVTHKNGKDKTQVSFSWTAPSQSAGNVYFRATVVQGFDPSVYWWGIYSAMIKG